MAGRVVQTLEESNLTTPRQRLRARQQFTLVRFAPVAFRVCDQTLRQELLDVYESTVR